MSEVGDITVAIDGTKILANAVKQMQLANGQIAELLQKAEDADSAPLQDGLTIPDEIQRRQDRIAKLQEAKAAMEARAKERLIEEQAAYQEKLAARQAKEQSTGKKPNGKAPAPPKEGPRDKDQYNFTDPESRIMKVRGGFEQSYNAQAAVEVTTMLVVGQHVTDQANDKQQLIPNLAALSPVIGPVSKALVDTGYFSQAAALTAETGDHAPTIYAAMARQNHGRSVAQLGSAGRPAATARRRHRRRTHGPPPGHRRRQTTLRPAQANRGARVRHHQASHWLPSLPAARPGKGQP